VVALVLADRGLALLNALLRSVAKAESACGVLSCVRSDMLCGFGGLRSIIYHRESGRMIIATKCLTPKYSQRGAVRLSVTLKRIAPPARWRVDKGRGRLAQDGNYYYLFVWYRHLPSWREGEVLSDEDCGASITRLEKVIERLVEDEESLGPNPVFYIWLEGGGKGSRPCGLFQD